MRIGVNCFNLQESMGGLRQYFQRLFRELLEHDADNSYVFFHGEHNIPELELLGTDRWKEGAILLAGQENIREHLGGVDLYFCPFGILWPRPVPIPSVVMLVDIQEVFFPQFFSPLDLWNRAYHYRGSTRSADRVITISQYSKQTIVEHHRVPGKKVRVVHLAADDFFFSPQAEPLSLKLPDRYMFYPANRWLHKNHDNLLKALALLRDEYGVGVPCVLTGFDYPSGYPLREKIAELGLDDLVHVVGYVSREDLKGLYRGAALFCFPSLFEGFGMPLVEAMASGCPIVCSSTTSVPEVAGDAAVYFDPQNPRDIAEKVLTAWNDPALRARLSAAGAGQARKYSVERMAAAHREVFREAAAAFSRPRYLLEEYVREPLHRMKMQMRKARGT